MSTLKTIRESKKYTQKQACAILGVSLRSYVTYENDSSKNNTIKYRYMCDFLEKTVTIDEEHGILTLEEIREKCKNVLDCYNVRYAILFGSYANGSATENSDVDLLISTDATGLRFYGIAERLRNELKKKIDLLDIAQLNNNQQLTDEIMKDGIRIYG